MAANQAVNDWHLSITPGLRNHLAGKIVKAIFPPFDPSADIVDQRIQGLISYAKEKETNIFEAAPGKEAYYRMLAEKIYELEKEMYEKKRRRAIEQQQQDQ